MDTNNKPVNASSTYPHTLFLKHVVKLVIQKHVEPLIYIALLGFIIALLTVNPFNKFSGSYHAAHWELRNENANGTVDVSNEPFSIVLTGSDNHSNQTGITDYTIVAQESGVLSFNWWYSTPDAPFWDPFGVVINGKFIELVGSGGKRQFGKYSVQISKGDEFGFRIISRDNFIGPAKVIISNFSEPKEFPLTANRKNTAATNLNDYE